MIKKKNRGNRAKIITFSSLPHPPPLFVSNADNNEAEVKKIVNFSRPKAMGYLNGGIAVNHASGLDRSCSATSQSAPKA